MKVLTKERALFRHLRRHCSSSRCSREQVFHAQTTGRDLCEYLMKMRKKDSHSTRCCRHSSSREVLHGGVLVHGMAVSLVAAAQRSVGTLCLNTRVCGFVSGVCVGKDFRPTSRTSLHSALQDWRVGSSQRQVSDAVEIALQIGISQSTRRRFLLLHNLFRRDECSRGRRVHGSPMNSLAGLGLCKTAPQTPHWWQELEPTPAMSRFHSIVDAVLLAGCHLVFLERRSCSTSFGSARRLQYRC